MEGHTLKTLNDVIESLDIEYLNEIGRYEGFGRYMLYDEEIADVLHYLKEYKKLDWKDDLLDAYRYAIMVKESGPLTWDELKGMVGKPVWTIESILDDDGSGIKRKGRWNIIREITQDLIIFYFGLPYHKSWRGIGWQAYRKERE